MELRQLAQQLALARRQVLAAEASKASQVLEATGKAEAIMLVAKADAEALHVVGEVANSDLGKAAVTLTLAQDAIKAHQAIASESTLVLTDGRTGDNISSTVAQAIAVSSSLKLTES